MSQFNKFRGTRGVVALWHDSIRFRYMITDEAKRRVRVLAFWEQYGDAAVRDAFQVSRRTLFRWQRALRRMQGRLEGLNPRSTAPHRTRTRAIPAGIAERIIALRRDHPRLGKEKIHGILKHEGYPGSRSTVGRFLVDLTQRGRLRVPAMLTVSGRTGRLMERVVKRRTKLRRPHGYRVLEADTVVRFIDGIKRYILTGIDTEARTAFAGAYTNHGSASAADFLRKTRTVLPDCPGDVQTDNGSEFALHFHAAVEEAGLHFNTHPRSPKENAHIERFNRTITEEFLQHQRSLLRDDVPEFNRKLADWLIWYNAERPHYALGQVPPLRHMMASLPAEKCQMWWTHTHT